MTKKTRIGSRGVLGAILVSVSFSVFAQTVVYKNFGPGNSFGSSGWRVGGPLVTPRVPFGQAMEFSPSQGGYLSTIEVGMGPLLSSDNAFTASIWSDAQGVPGAVLESIEAVHKDLTVSDIVKFISAGRAYLVPSTKYWLVLMPIDDFFAAWGLTEPKVNGNSAETKDAGSTWTPEFRTLGAFRISVAPLTCSGFEPPLARGPVTVKKNRPLPFKGQLFGAGGQLVDDSGIVAPPVIQVIFDNSVDVSDDVLSSRAGTNGNQFEFLGGKWRFNLKIKNFTDKGTYTVTMESGDTTEYQIDDPTCTGQFVIK